jgi:hypothetical protein
MRFHVSAAAPNLMALLLSGGALVGCGSDAAPPLPPPTATCTGPTCLCGAGNLCTCTRDGDCNVQCGSAGCALACDETSKCMATGTGPVSITCTDNTDCKGQGGDDSAVRCSGDSDCDLKAGDDSTALCDGASKCKINIGLRGDVQCLEMADCDIKCDGDCTVACATTATCMVNCGAGDAGIAAETCPDGRIVCGGC